MAQKNGEIIPCLRCGAKNRIPPQRLGMPAKCGKCGSPLGTFQRGDGMGAPYLYRCIECGARNRIPSQKIHSNPRCGKCGSPFNIQELFLPQPLMLTDGNFESKVLKSPMPVLVFAWAPWCPTCKSAMPTVDEFGSLSKGRIRVGKLNVDANPLLSSNYNILSVPTLLFFDGGRLKETMPGVLQKEVLMNKMAPYFSA